MSAVFPLPEIFSDGWRIVPLKEGSRGSVDIGEKVIKVPVDSADHVERMMQLAAIKWDDPTIEIPDTIIHQTVERYRLEFLLGEVGIDHDFGADYELFAVVSFSRDASVAEEAKRRIEAEPTKANSLAVSRWLTNDMRCRNSTVLRETLAGLGAPGESAKAPNGSGRWNLFASPGLGELDYPCSGKWRLTVRELIAAGRAAMRTDNDLAKLPQLVRSQLPKRFPSKISNFHAILDVVVQFAKWGNMSVEEPPRHLPAGGKLPKRWKPTKEGAFPRYIHRFCGDGQIFARRRRIPGGTVLIDHSGSMHLDVSQVHAMVKAAPGCTVASYAGNRVDGVLRVLARDGRVVANDMMACPCSGTNVVDFPALLWAHRHSHPHIWVSDMGVTGVFDQECVGNLAMCVPIVEHGKFFVVDNAEEAVRLLQRLRGFYQEK